MNALLFVGRFRAFLQKLDSPRRQLHSFVIVARLHLNLQRCFGQIWIARTQAGPRVVSFSDLIQLVSRVISGARQVFDRAGN